MQRENRWFICLRTEVSLAKPIPQLGHWVGAIVFEHTRGGRLASRTRGNKDFSGTSEFPTALSPRHPLWSRLLTMASTNTLSFESLLPLVQRMNYLLPVSQYYIATFVWYIDVLYLSFPGQRHGQRTTLMLGGSAEPPSGRSGKTRHIHAGKGSHPKPFEFGHRRGENIPGPFGCDRIPSL